MREVAQALRAENAALRTQFQDELQQLRAMLVDLQMQQSNTPVLTQVE